MIGLIGKKLGHTRVYDAKGAAIPVTVVLAGPNRVLQCKNKDGKDGYDAVKLGFDDQKESRLTKPEAAQFKKTFKSLPVKRIHEFRDFSPQVKAGDIVGVDLFQVGDFVDAIGVTKGRGFEGVVKRHGFRGGDMTHGAKGWHRRSGAIGCRLFPGHVNRGMKMPGHMGQVRRTVQNLEVIQVRKDDNLILIKGSMPGAEGDYVIIRGAKKMTREVVADRAKKMAERAKGKSKSAKDSKQAKK